MTIEDIQRVEAEQKQFHESLDHETDRGCCLMAASYLEYQLEIVIKKLLVNNLTTYEKLFDFNGPLGTFSSKIEMAYSLGLIGPKVRQDLNFLRKIRNSFAHEHKLLSFSDKPMCDIAEHFYYNSLTKIKGEYRHNFIKEVVGLFAVIVSKSFSTEHIKEESDIVLDEKMLLLMIRMKELKDKGLIIGQVAPEEEI